MILQVITPNNTSFDLKVNIPQNYVGKEVHCLFYIEDEAKKNIEIIEKKKKPSDCFGILNDKEAKKFESHINKMRAEWDRNI